MTTRKQLIIAVTSVDILFGTRCTSTDCPIALSLHRRYPNRAIEVSFEDVRIDGQRKCWTPRKMELWMNRFDKGEPVKPTTFFLDCAV